MNTAPSGLEWVNRFRHLIAIEGALFACCDFVAQIILVCTAGVVYYSVYLSAFSKIYRCWIVWDRNIHVVIVPSILAFAFLRLSSSYLSCLLADFDLLFLAIWIVGSTTCLYVEKGQTPVSRWGNPLNTTGLAMSMIVNAVSTSLIVFRIFKVFRAVKPTPEERISDVTRRSPLRPLMFVLIESGMLLFSIQLVRLVVGSVSAPTDVVDAYAVIASIHEMLNVIIKSNIFYFSDNVG